MVKIDSIVRAPSLTRGRRALASKIGDDMI